MTYDARQVRQFGTAGQQGGAADRIAVRRGQHRRRRAGRQRGGERVEDRRGSQQHAARPRHLDRLRFGAGEGGVERARGRLGQFRAGPRADPAGHLVGRRDLDALDELYAKSLRSDIPDFRAGDTVKVHVRVIEGSRSRVQVFQGVVIRRHGGGLRETFTVHKVSFGVGVERTFPVHTPNIDHIEVVTRGDVRRVKLYYLRDLRGKAAKIRDKRETTPAS